MIPEPKHGRKFTMSTIGMTRVRTPKHMGVSMLSVRDDIEETLIKIDFFRNTPFTWLAVHIALGLKYEEKPRIGRVNKKYGDLDLGIEIDVNDIVNASEENIYEIFRTAIVKSLNALTNKYDVPHIE